MTALEPWGAQWDSCTTRERSLNRFSKGWHRYLLLATPELHRVFLIHSWNGDIAYILYNDQRPHTEEKRQLDDLGHECGHTKGVVLLDKTQGYWLVHSTPHFPPVKDVGQYSYPESGVPNGQNFICVTYPLEFFQTIGEQLQINQPSVYDCDVPDSLASLLPALNAVCKKSREQLVNGSFLHSKPASNRSIALTSLGGTEFISFAKGRSFKNDLYHSWVAPSLQSNLLVQFWIRSTGILPSNCTLGWKVLNIKVISLGDRVTFGVAKDHSKWAVSTTGGGLDGAAGWVCVGDINRDEAEESRGGGTVCLQDAAVWKAYRTAAVDCEMCDGETSKCDVTAGGRMNGYASVAPRVAT
uniref:Deoxyribonuclease-2-alpha n=1 Tax=Esox lucius TaxID=8010 RepID=A0A3P9A0W3_ESOLU